jgi:hypothetical protein
MEKANLNISLPGQNNQHDRYNSLNVSNSGIQGTAAHFINKSELVKRKQVGSGEKTRS